MAARACQAQAWLLVTDLDGTLVGHDQSLAAFNKVWLTLQRTCSVQLVFATGRTIANCSDIMSQLPRPDFWITACGAAITASNSSSRIEKDWEAHILGAGWDRKRVVSLAESVLGTLAVLGPDDEQTDLRVCLYCDPECVSRVTALLPELVASCKASSTPVRAIFSQAVFLELVPTRAGKGPAVAFLAERLGVLYENTIVCGDSGNDRDLLLEGGGGAVLVGNALPELRDAVLPELEDAAFEAAGCYAAGVIEGAAHFGLLPLIEEDQAADENNDQHSVAGPGTALTRSELRRLCRESRLFYAGICKSKRANDGDDGDAAGKRRRTTDESASRDINEHVESVHLNKV
mmetsp:Transcript_35142/g.80148  ORF Transcript_35142/g.80148 Transcript_35142/m.80148 type:complete len:347 (+) Transcript_35142:17-1057(+)